MEDNEACGEPVVSAAAVVTVAAAAAAASVCYIEPREGRTLSAAFDLLAIHLLISFFICLHQRQNSSLRSILDEGVGLVGGACC